MGRPLNKKYFGNRNIGTTGEGDNVIGGEGVASVTINTAGSYTSALPAVAFSAPNLITGVTATGTVHGNALSAVVTTAGTGYNLADSLAQNISSGNEGIYATWNVTGLTVVGITLNNGGSAVDTGDEYTFAASGFATPIRVRVTASNTGVASAVEIVEGGVWTTGALPGNSIGMTLTQVSAGQDFNGSGLQVNFTAWGVSTVAVATQGDYTAITSGAKSTTATPAGGTGATLTITYGVSGVVIDERGSGYTSVSDAAPTFSAGSAAGTSVLTTDLGNIGSSTNQENAILFSAITDGSTPRSNGDIIAQKGSRRYRVITQDGTSVCSLVSATPSAVGEMAINATDSDGGTYWILKLTSHLALVKQNTGTQFADESQVHWTLDAPTAGESVQIDNA